MATTVWVKLHSQTMSYQGNPCYVWAVMPGAHLKPAYTLPSDCYSQPALSRDRQTVPWFRNWVVVCAANVFNLNCLCSRSLSCWPCSLAVALHTRSHDTSAWTSWNTEIWKVLIWNLRLSVQTSIARYLHVLSAVTLVWGSLRLVLIIMMCSQFRFVCVCVCKYICMLYVCMYVFMYVSVLF